MKYTMTIPNVPHTHADTQAAMINAAYCTNVAIFTTLLDTHLKQKHPTAHVSS